MRVEGELAVVVRAKIVQRLHETQNKTMAAEVLGIRRNALYRFIEQLNIQPAEWGADYQGTGSDAEIALAALRQLLREEIVQGPTSRCNCADDRETERTKENVVLK